MEKQDYGHLRVLYIEDEDGVRKRVANALGYYVKEVCEAGDGQEGYELFLEESFDIIICDIQMPRLSGIDLVKKIRQKDIAIPIIMLTAHSNEEYLLELVNLQIQAFVLKPVDIETLLERIDFAFKGRFSGSVKLCEEMSLDINSALFRYKKEEVSLNKKQRDFLALLAYAKGNILGYETIEMELWPDSSMSMTALKTFIRDLRKKLPVNIIENVAQVGYRLQCEK